MRRIFANVLIGSAVLATAAMAADDYVIMPKSTREFKSVAGGYASQQALVNRKNSQASVTIRDKNGQVEVHANWEDHMFILAGEAKLVLGGTVEKPNTTDLARHAVKASRAARLSCCIPKTTSSSRSTLRTRCWSSPARWCATPW